MTEDLQLCLAETEERNGFLADCERVALQGGTLGPRTLERHQEKSDEEKVPYFTLKPYLTMPSLVIFQWLPMLSQHVPGLVATHAPCARPVICFA